MRHRRRKEKAGWFYDNNIDRDFDPKSTELHDLEKGNGVALRELVHTLRVPVRTSERQVHFLEVLAALAETREGLELPTGAERVRCTLRLTWARRLPQLLTLPPFETCSDAYAEEILDVYHERATLNEVALTLTLTLTQTLTVTLSLSPSLTLTLALTRSSRARL